MTRVISSLHSVNGLVPALHLSSDRISMWNTAGDGDAIKDGKIRSLVTGLIRNYTMLARSLTSLISKTVILSEKWHWV